MLQVKDTYFLIDEYCSSKAETDNLDILNYVIGYTVWTGKQKIEWMLTDGSFINTASHICYGVYTSR